MDLQGGTGPVGEIYQIAQAVARTHDRGVLFIDTAWVLWNSSTTIAMHSGRIVVVEGVSVTRFVLSLMGSALLAGLPVLSASAQDAGSGHPAAGEHLFKQNCAACHSLEAGKKLVGPSLHAELKGAHPKKTPEEVKAIVVNGKNAMPPVGAAFNPQDLDDLLAYLRTQ